MKKISIVVPVFNEEENINKVYDRVTAIFKKCLAGYQYEILFIDNGSKDTSPQKLRQLAAKDKHIKVILNSKNFGYSRSVFHGLKNSFADATFLMNADMQDPPELLPEFVKKWEAGAVVVVGKKEKSKENWVIRRMRGLYYWIVRKASTIEQINQFNGFGLYDRSFMDALRDIHDPEPYLKGIISELASDIEVIYYTHMDRKYGAPKNQKFSIMYDYGMQAITSYTKIFLRVTTFAGIGVMFLALAFSVIFFIYGVANHWTFISVILVCTSLQAALLGGVLFCLGMVAEFVSSINIRVMDRPLVIEKERLNFD